MRRPHRMDQRAQHSRHRYGRLCCTATGSTAAPAATEAAAGEAAATEAAAEEAPATAAGDTIKIGGIHPLTGGLAADGTQMDNAIKMAIEELNAAGGVLDGTMFEYLSADSTGNAEVGQTEAERLVNDGAVALICCFQSAVTANVAALAERTGVPLVIDVAVADAILDQGYKNTFRLQPNATNMGENGAQFLVDMAAANGPGGEDGRLSLRWHDRLRRQRAPGLRRQGARTWHRNRRGDRLRSLQRLRLHHGNDPHQCEVAGRARRHRLLQRWARWLRAMPKRWSWMWIWSMVWPRAPTTCPSS